MNMRGPRPTIVLCSLYGALIGGWLGFACGIAPSFIDGVHHGSTSPLVTRLVQTWRASIPAATAMERWLVFSSAVAIGGLFHLVIVLFVRELDRRKRERRPAIHGAEVEGRASRPSCSRGLPRVDDRNWASSRIITFTSRSGVRSG